MEQTPFNFAASLSLSLVTNRRASDLAELLGHLREVPGAVIYYHTHHFLVREYLLLFLFLEHQRERVIHLN